MLAGPMRTSSGHLATMVDQAHSIFQSPWRGQILDCAGLHAATCPGCAVPGMAGQGHVCTVLWLWQCVCWQLHFVHWQVCCDLAGAFGPGKHLVP